MNDFRNTNDSPDLVLHTIDAANANGRTLQPGEGVHLLAFTLADHRLVHLFMGDETWKMVAAVLFAKLRDDAREEAMAVAANLPNTATPMPSGKREELLHMLDDMRASNVFRSDTAFAALRGFAQRLP